MQQASREVRAAVIKQAEAVVCTLSTAGGELLSVLAGSSDLFDAVIIDEVRSTPDFRTIATIQVHRGVQ